MDPYAVLGVRPGSGNKEIAAAYREAAKRWHPDLAGGDEAAARMAEINAAYDLVRAAEQHGGPGPWRPGETTPADRAAARARGKGSWLIAPLRIALGPELLDSLTDGEDVKLVTPTSTWASPRAILAVTERRLLWLLDDAPVARVHSLRFANVLGDDVSTVFSRMLRMPVVPEVLERAPDTPVLAVADAGDPVSGVLAAVHAGAGGYLVAPDPEVLADAVRRAAAGEAVFSPGLAEVVLEEYGRPADPAQARLTPREADVLRLVVDGLTARQIATRLVLSPRTVENHTQRVLGRLGLPNRAALVRYAVENGLV